MGDATFVEEVLQHCAAAHIELDASRAQLVHNACTFHQPAEASLAILSMLTRQPAPPALTALAPFDRCSEDHYFALLPALWQAVRYGKGEAAGELLQLLGGPATVQRVLQFTDRGQKLVISQRTQGYFRRICDENISLLMCWDSCDCTQSPRGGVECNSLLIWAAYHGMSEEILHALVQVRSTADETALKFILHNCM
jgi:hypothetical protein